jgi:membrane protease subunit (stomatin/prohibitin family)
MAIIDVLKYEGPNDELVWKWSPKNGNQKRENQLRIGTQLVVNESQDAFMFKGGKLLDVFGAGTHTLTSLNIPFLADVIGLAFGGDTPFTVEVFYVNKALSQDAKWGLMPFNIVEPNFKVPIPITCRGSYSVKIVDSRKFLTEIVGVSSLYNQLELQKLFRGIITESTKNAIWKLSKDLGLGPLELEYMVKELSNSIQPAIKFAMSKYGLEISFFSVEGISVVDEDERVKKIVEDYHRIMSEDMEEKLRLKRRAEQLNVYKVERTFDTTEAAATNIGGGEGGNGSGGSGILGTVVGLGMAMPLANQVGGMVQNQMNTGNTVASAAKISKDVNHQDALDNTSEKESTEFQEPSSPASSEINVMMKMLRKMSAKNHASMPVNVNIPSKEVYDLFKDQMDITNKDLNSQIGLLVESQIDNLREQLKEQIESFVENYYNETTTKSGNAKS